MPADGVRELVAAEGRLFARLGLEHHSRVLELSDAPVARARVLETGVGPPLLLVHGAGMTASVWAPLAAAMPERRLIAVDLPGCGLTDPFDYRGVDLRSHTRSFMAAIMEALGLDRAPVAANSLGAMFALQMACDDPALLSELILLGAPGVALPGARASAAMALYSRPRLGRIMSAVSPPIRPNLARRVLASMCGRHAVDAVPFEMFEVTAAAMRVSETTTRTLMPELFDWRQPLADVVLTDPEIASVTQPTLMIWGESDRFQSPSAGSRACGLMVSARMVQLPGGHHPWWDEASGCAELIRAHLRQPA